jgi:hypothetical protein
MLNASNLCPHSCMRRLDVKGWIKSRRKCNAKVKVKCVMRNEQIDGLTTNHNLAPLLEQKQMWTLDVEEVESSSKIDWRDVLWWMSIKDACRLGAPITAKLSKKGCISLAVKGKPSHTAHKYDSSRWAPPLTWKTYFSKTSLSKIPFDHFLKTCYELVWSLYLPKMNHSTIHSPLHILLRGLIISGRPKTTCTLFFTIILNMKFLHIQLRCRKKFVKVVVTLTYTQAIVTSA